MNAFRLRRFSALVILQCVRWYCEYTISYRQLKEMMAERGVDHTTICRWSQRYAPQLENRWYGAVALTAVAQNLAAPRSAD